MTSVFDYVNALDNCRDKLAANLTAMGVPSDSAEKMNALAPKVLEIPQTGTAKDGIAVFSRTVNKIDAQAFICAYCLTEVYIPDNIVQIGDYAFQYCDTITRLHIPASVTIMGSLVFQYCTGLENVTVGNGFVCDLDISASTKYTADVLNAIIANLGTGAFTLTIGSTNLAKLSDEEKSVATSKGWTLA